MTPPGIPKIGLASAQEIAEAAEPELKYWLTVDDGDRAAHNVNVILSAITAAVAAVKEEDKKPLDLTEPHPESSATRGKRAAEILGLSQADGEDFVREADQTMRRVSGVAEPRPESTHVLQKALREIMSYGARSVIKREDRGEMCRIAEKALEAFSVGRGNAAGAAPGNPKSVVAAPQAESTGDEILGLKEPVSDNVNAVLQKERERLFREGWLSACVFFIDIDACDREHMCSIELEKRIAGCGSDDF